MKRFRCLLVARRLYTQQAVLCEVPKNRGPQSPADITQGERVKQYLQDNEFARAFAAFQILREQKHTDSLQSTNIPKVLLSAAIKENGQTKGVPGSIQLLSELQKLKLADSEDWIQVLFGEINYNRPEEALNIIGMLEARTPEEHRALDLARLASLLLQRGNVSDVTDTEILAAFTSVHPSAKEAKSILQHYKVSSKLQDQCIFALKRILSVNLALYRTRIGYVIRRRDHRQLNVMYDEASRNLESILEPTFASFISAFLTCRRTDKALETWNDMVRTGIIPTSVAWTALLEGGGQRRPAAAVKTLWQSMIKSGVQPDAVLYTIYINSLFRASDQDAALKVFHEMQTVGGVQPNQVTMNAVIQGITYSNKRLSIDSLLTFLEQHGFSADIWTFNTILRPLMKEGRMNDVLRVFELMEKASVAPDIVTYTEILDGLFKNRNKPTPEVVNAMLQDMEKHGIQSNVQTYTALIDGLLKSEGNVTAAYEILHTMRQKKIRPNVITYTAMIRGLMESGQVDAALSIWDDMRRQNILPDSPTWNRMIDGFGTMGRVKDMMHFYNLMRTSASSPKPNKYTYSNVLNALTQANEVHLAGRVIRDMVALDFAVESDGLRAAVKRVASIGVDTRPLQMR